MGVAVRTSTSGRRALRGSPMVNAETRERILRIARELNYKVDKNASSLRLRNAGTLALLFFEDPTNDDSLINPFFHSMLGSITRACALHGQDLPVSFQQLSTDWPADYEDSHQADGIHLLGCGDYPQSPAPPPRLRTTTHHCAPHNARPHPNPPAPAHHQHPHNPRLRATPTSRHGRAAPRRRRTIPSSC